MKKFLIIIVTALLLSGCSLSIKKDGVVNQTAEITLGTVLGQEIDLPKLPEVAISKRGRYNLDCQTSNYTAIVTGGFLIDKSYVKISEGSEKQVLYVENDTAKFFGAEYRVIQDDEDYLIIVRTYSGSGLTETVTINKEKGVGFDTKTMGMGISGGPQSDTYILRCIEI